MSRATGLFLVFAQALLPWTLAFPAQRSWFVAEETAVTPLTPQTCLFLLLKELHQPKDEMKQSKRHSTAPSLWLTALQTLCFPF